MSRFLDSHIIQTGARWLLRLEPLLLLWITFVFWYPAPPVRDHWLWLLWLCLPMIGARWVLYRRLWTRTPLDGYFLAFAGLCFLNIYAAPYTRGILMLGRPLQGMVLFAYCAEYARTRGSMTGLLATSVLFTALAGTAALTATQWVDYKFDQFQFILERLPVVNWNTMLPGAYVTFNPNEIGGALAWLCPLVGGIMIYCWRSRQRLVVSLAVTGAFVLALTGLFLGQSRFSLAGVLVTMMILTVLLVPKGRWRYALLAVLGFLTVLEVSIVLNLLPPGEETGASGSTPTGSISARDEGSFNKRFGLWESGLRIIGDYPLTGVGMSMYRDSRVREAYPAPGRDHPPHAHNEFIQVGTDLGLPGLIIYAAWHIVAGWMLFKTWEKGDFGAKAVAAAVAGGLVAHGVYGMGDAITLWDRFAFVYWWLLGLAGAGYVLTCRGPFKHDSAASSVPDTRQATAAKAR
jgi:O-antigen ligase